MNFVRVVRGGTTAALEEKINEILNANDDAVLVDIKLSGAYDGKNDDYMVVIIFREK
jgi:hypothetical protein